ncbi:MAG: NRDE family protein [Betaproteobacteria bacterium]|nr:MAG: NRDE family protein [Betaproteobacteria bacterium]
MCLAIVALNAHPHFAVVVAANRDEYHARPTTAAHWWADEEYTSILAGRDLEAGGTWLGVTREGRWAFVTNVREGGRHDPAAPSRGSLVPRVLRDNRDPQTALASAIADAAHYNGFNLMAGDVAAACWGSNRGERGCAIAGGVHGLSNARLDTPWPKLARTQAGVAAWAQQGRNDIEPLFALLADRTRAGDEELPETGVSLEWERVLSAPFITGERYGTRCSTVLCISREGEARFVEQSFDAHGEPAGRVDTTFTLTAE